MNSKEIAQLVGSGKTQVFSIDAKHKTDIQRQQLNSMITEAKRALSQNKDIDIILIKRGA